MRIYAALVAVLLSSVPGTSSADLFDVITTISSGGKYTKLGEEGPSGTNQSKKEIYSNIQDKQLIDAFYVLSEDGTRSMVAPDLLAADQDQGKDAKYAATLWPDQLTIRKELGYFREFVDAKRELMKYPSATSSMKQIAERYVQVAKKRRNVVKLYKEGLSIQIFGADTSDTYRNDKVLIEYSSYGDIVSILSFSLYVQMEDTSKALVRNTMESPCYTNVRADFHFNPGTINKLTSKFTPAQIDAWLVKEL